MKKLLLALLLIPSFVLAQNQPMWVPGYTGPAVPYSHGYINGMGMGVPLLNEPPPTVIIAPQPQQYYPREKVEANPFQEKAMRQFLNGYQAPPKKVIHKHYHYNFSQPETYDPNEGLLKLRKTWGR